MKTVITLMLAGILMAAPNAFAEDGAGKSEAASQDETPNVGNTICPVSGEAVGSMGDAAIIEYEGKQYQLCCSMCKKEFLSNPEKYSKIAEEQAADEKQESEE